MERAEQILEKFNDTIKQRNDRIAQLQQEMDDLQKNSKHGVTEAKFC